MDPNRRGAAQGLIRSADLQARPLDLSRHSLPAPLLPLRRCSDHICAVTRDKYGMLWLSIRVCVYDHGVREMRLALPEEIFVQRIGNYLFRLQLMRAFEVIVPKSTASQQTCH